MILQLKLSFNGRKYIHSSFASVADFGELTERFAKVLVYSQSFFCGCIGAHDR